MVQDFVAAAVGKEIHSETLATDAIYNVLLDTTDTALGGIHASLVPDAKPKIMKIGKHCQAYYSMKV